MKMPTVPGVVSGASTRRRCRSLVVIVIVVCMGLAVYLLPVTLNIQPQSLSTVWTEHKPRRGRKHEQKVKISDVTSDVTGGAAGFSKAPAAVYGEETRASEDVSTAFNVSEFLQTYQLHIPEDLLLIGPFRFRSTYKNPCWRSPSLGKTIACFPYFYLAGFPKAGTTDVFVRLTKHPEVSRFVAKEPHWLTRHRYNSEENGKFDRYLNVFRDAVTDIQRSEVEGYHHKIVGDCSASTFWDNNNWRIFPENAGLSEPRYLTADYIKHINPNTKFIVMIRDPVERLYSDYLYFHNKRAFRNMTLFHDAVSNTIQEIQDCLKTQSLRYCVYRRTDLTPRIRLRLGMYHVYIEDYLLRFPRQQMLMIKMENYANNISKYLKQIFNFLQLSPMDPQLMASIANNSKTANTRSRAAVAVGDMYSDTRKLLQDFYTPYNTRLAELLGEEFNYNVHARAT